MLSITRAEQLEAGTRSLAAEFLVTLCEAREKVSLSSRVYRQHQLGVAAYAPGRALCRYLETCLAMHTWSSEIAIEVCLFPLYPQAPGMMRKLPNFSANLFETLMMFLLDVEDEPLWHQVSRSPHSVTGPL